MGFSMIFSMLLLTGGGGDLLDFIQSADYWQADKTVEQADIKTMEQIINGENMSQADRLMAIRTVGELGSAKDADAATKAKAIAILTPLVASKEPFVGQYAKRSIAWVKGEDPEPRSKPTEKQLAADLALLPGTSTIVGQMKIDNGVGPVDLSKLMPKMPNSPEVQKMMAEMSMELTRGIVEASGMIGNARVDSATVGVTFYNAGDDDGYAAIVLRGMYDRVSVQIAVQDLIEEEGTDEDEKVSFYSIGDIEIISVEDQWSSFAVLMPSNERAVVLFGGGGGENRPALPIEAVAKKMQADNPKLELNDAVMAQVKQIDRSKADVWLAAEVPAMMRQERGIKEVVGPFDALHAFAVKDEKGVLNLSWKADGKDAAEVAKSVKFINDQVAEGVADMKRQMEQMPPEMKPMMEPMVKMLGSIKAKAQGTSMTGGMKLPGNVGTMMPMWMMPMGADIQGVEEFEAEEAEDAEAEDAEAE